MKKIMITGFIFLASSMVYASSMPLKIPMAAVNGSKDILIDEVDFGAIFSNGDYAGFQDYNLEPLTTFKKIVVPATQDNTLPSLYEATLKVGPYYTKLTCSYQFSKPPKGAKVYLKPNGKECFIYPY